MNKKSLSPKFFMICVMFYDLLGDCFATGGAVIHYTSTIEEISSAYSLLFYSVEEKVKSIEHKLDLESSLEKMYFKPKLEDANAFYTATACLVGHDCDEKALSSLASPAEVQIAKLKFLHATACKLLKSKEAAYQRVCECLDDYTNNADAPNGFYKIIRGCVLLPTILIKSSFTAIDAIAKYMLTTSQNDSSSIVDVAIKNSILIANDEKQINNIISSIMNNLTVLKYVLKIDLDTEENLYPLIRLAAAITITGNQLGMWLEQKSGEFVYGAMSAELGSDETIIKLLNEHFAEIGVLKYRKALIEKMAMAEERKQVFDRLVYAFQLNQKRDALNYGVDDKIKFLKLNREHGSLIIGEKLPIGYISQDGKVSLFKEDEMSIKKLVFLALTGTVVTTMVIPETQQAVLAQEVAKTELTRDHVSAIGSAGVLTGLENVANVLKKVFNTIISENGLVQVGKMNMTALIRGLHEDDSVKIFAVDKASNFSTGFSQAAAAIERMIRRDSLSGLSKESFAAGASEAEQAVESFSVLFKSIIGHYNRIAPVNREKYAAFWGINDIEKLEQELNEFYNMLDKNVEYRPLVGDPVLQKALHSLDSDINEAKSLRYNDADREPFSIEGITLTFKHKSQLLSSDIDSDPQNVVSSALEQIIKQQLTDFAQEEIELTLRTYAGKQSLVDAVIEKPISCDKSGVAWPGSNSAVFKLPINYFDEIKIKTTRNGLIKDFEKAIQKKIISWLKEKRVVKFAEIHSNPEVIDVLIQKLNLDSSNIVGTNKAEKIDADDIKLLLKDKAEVQLLDKLEITAYNGSTMEELLQLFAEKFKLRISDKSTVDRLITNRFIFADKTVFASEWQKLISSESISRELQDLKKLDYNRGYEELITHGSATLKLPRYTDPKDISVVSRCVESLLRDRITAYKNEVLADVTPDVWGLTRLDGLQSECYFGRISADILDAAKHVKVRATRSEMPIALVRAYNGKVSELLNSTLTGNVDVYDYIRGSNGEVSDATLQIFIDSIKQRIMAKKTNGGVSKSDVEKLIKPVLSVYLANKLPKGALIASKLKLSSTAEEVNASVIDAVVGAIKTGGKLHDDVTAVYESVITDSMSTLDLLKTISAAHEADLEITESQTAVEALFGGAKNVAEMANAINGMSPIRLLKQLATAISPEDLLKNGILLVDQMEPIAFNKYKAVGRCSMADSIIDKALVSDDKVMDTTLKDILRIPHPVSSNKGIYYVSLPDVYKLSFKNVRGDIYDSLVSVMNGAKPENERQNKSYVWMQNIFLYIKSKFSAG